MVNIENYLRLNVTDAILVCISTILIMLFVKVFFWKYAKEYLDARKAHIQNELDESAIKLKESESLKDQYEAQLANVKDEASEILSDAKKMAVLEATDIVSKAKENAEIIKDKAARDIENEKTKVKNEIKEEISEVAFLAAKKVVGKELDEEVHKKYVDDFINQAGEEKWQG